MTLLKNRNGVLPIPEATTVLVAGPAAANLGPLHGSWSYTWQGDNEAAYPESTGLFMTFEKLGSERVASLRGRVLTPMKTTIPPRLTELAEGVDYIVLALGERAYAESPGWIDDLNLPEQQKALVRAAEATRQAGHPGVGGGPPAHRSRHGATGRRHHPGLPAGKPGRQGDHRRYVW